MKFPDLKDYRLDALIGEGSYGLVFRATHRDGEPRAIKFLKAQAINPGLVGSCFRTLANRRPHPGLAKVYESQIASHPFYYVTPLYGWEDSATGEWVGNSLERFIGALTVDQSLQLIRQMAEALTHLHRCELIHGGFKPSNVFVTGKAETGYQTKVTDWGQGYVIGLQYLEMGDLGFYASPEQLDNGDPSHGAGKRWDVYAFGVVAYRLLTGRLPRLQKQYQEFLRDLQKGISHVPAAAFGSGLEQPDRYVDVIVEEEAVHWPADPSTEMEAECREIIDKCLLVDPRERYSDMRDVTSALELVEQKLNYARLKRAASEDYTRSRKRLGRWRTAAMIGFVLLALSVGGIGLGWTLWKKEAEEFAVQESGLQKALRELQNASSETLEEQQAALTEMAKQARETRSEILSQTKETRAFLRQAQKNGDRFFEIILKNRHSDVPEFIAERRKALELGREYYGSLLEVYGDSTDFSESAARVSRYLAEIEREIGGLARATYHYSAAELMLREILKNDPERSDVIEALAHVKRGQAEVFRRGGRENSAEAIAAIRESSNLWDQLQSALSPKHEVLVQIAENRLMEAEMLRGWGDRQGAAAALDAAVTGFDAANETKPTDHRVAGGLAKAYSNGARMLEESGQSTEAITTHQEAADWYGRAIKLNSARDDYHLGLGGSLAAIGLLSKEKEKIEDAAKVLAEIAPTDLDEVAFNPLAADVLKTLGDCYGILAREQEDGGETGAAIQWETQAIGYLEPIVAESWNQLDRIPAPIRLSLAERKTHLAQLQGLAKNHQDARDSLEESLRLLDSLLAVNATNPEYRRAFAQAQSEMGLTCEQIGDKTGAREHYKAAKSAWESYAAEHPEDDIAAQAVRWAQSQLDALGSESS